MTHPTPDGTIWTYIREETRSLYGMFWHGGSGRALVRIEPCVEGVHEPTPQQQRNIRQQVLSHFWRRVGVTDSTENLVETLKKTVAFIIDERDIFRTTCSDHEGDISEDLDREALAEMDRIIDQAQAAIRKAERGAG